jgi:phage tail-like protein
MAENEVYGNYTFILKDLDAEAMKFFQADLPSSTVQVTGVKAWDDKGKAIPMHGGGHQVAWTPIKLTRYLDESTALYDWYVKVCEKGAVEETKKAPTITCMNNDTVLFMWALEEAVPTAYSQNAANAQSNELLTETVTLTYVNAKMTRS